MKIQLNKICFGLPAKSFFMDYTVSQKRQLPVVKEFIVRIIHSLSSVSVDSLQHYFGFSDTEIRAALDDLLEESLIEWHEDKISLSNYASSHFLEVNGQMLPRFFEVTDKVDTVHFEMHGFKMIPNSIKKGGGGNQWISLSLSSDCYKNLSSKAQNAFDTNFQQFRELVKGEDIFTERQELYKINHVTHKYDAIIPIEVEYYIDSSSPTELKTEYLSTAVDEWDSAKSLFTVMDKAIPTVKNNNESKCFHNYLEASKDPFITKFWNEKSKSLELDLLINHLEKGLLNISSDTQLIIGNIYSDENSTSLLTKLKEIYSEKRNSFGLIWFTNADSNTWGRTKAMKDLTSNIYSLFDKRKKTSHVVLVIPCKSKQEAFELNNIYRTEDVKLLDCTNKFGGDSCEIILIPNVMVACLYHAPLADERNIKIPVGYISFNAEQVAKITKSALDWADSTAIFNHYFERKLTDIEETVLNRFFSPILSQRMDAI